MSFDELRTQARRTRHEVLSSCAHYTHTSGVDADVRCKLNTKDEIAGDVHREGFSEAIVGVSYLRFNSEELDEQSLVLARGGRVEFTDGSAFILDVLMPTNGPINVIWRVAQA